MAALSGQRIAIVGLGASGRAAARLALRHGGEVRVSDDAHTPALRAHAGELEAMGARVRLGGHDQDRIATSRLIVASPGIPPGAPVLSSLAAAGKRWISEPEFAFRFFRSSLIAVTGTNGKTTTSALAARMLEAAGVSVGLGGNIGGGLGPPASELALRDPAPEWLVVEMSSYQLGAVSRFRPDIGVVTNLSPDHLDRYPSRTAYYADKARLFANARADSRWVLGSGVPAALPLDDEVPGARYLFDADEAAGQRSGGPDGELAAYARDGWLMFALEAGEERVMPVADVALAGRAGLANTMAAGLAARLAGARTEAIARAARDFRPLPHRLERVVERDGVLWVNDSKATNVAAAAGAVRSFDRPIVLLAGGQDKGEDLAPFADAMRGRVRRVIVYGDARFRLEEALAGAASLVRVDTGFDAAVRAAERWARPGDILLLSPACASFDQFSDYEARGRRFAALARGEA
ncbi:MAG: UDP-N-acetylmuramoyl-L-alanine--D-glutamate ligase [Gammaproteobacteria bacterium]|nr:UDP-N-acetylmuramoyl-L-alanine--D-glutamate ligase [Gammaproteobacteria bacterium]MDE0260365.1 UDP-N-acetylmuramoyl-L-alanine--D-glutamate ligase [Gammaproteobacteria bacterium]